MDSLRAYITIDKEILGGQPVFKGTRVPVETLFDHLEQGISIEDFLEDLPTVTNGQVLAVLEIAGKLLASENLFEIFDEFLHKMEPLMGLEPTTLPIKIGMRYQLS
jgi:uncharacterized protein (DUF433 family)